MKFLNSVSLIGMRPELIVGILAVNEAYEKTGLEPFYTSFNDRVHSYGSLHFAGAAFDVDLPEDLDVSIQHTLFELVRACLPSEFDVIIEDAGKPNSHIHVEYQPKRAHN